MKRHVILCILFFICVCWKPEQITATSPKLDGLDLCQYNCGSSDRLTGPTRSKKTRDHPWDVKKYPTPNTDFCKLGCQIFFSELPNSTICQNNCGYYYRYHSTAGYSDSVEEARAECSDGCDIGIQVCQTGYYCANGLMTPCPAGKYREPVVNISVVSLDFAHQCTNCPFGRYRTRDKGKNADECSLCPIGKYANQTGLTDVAHCQRCPAGKVAEQEGMRLCIGITDRFPVADSTNMEYTQFENGEFKQENYFQNDVDFYRETVPFIGRW